MIGKNKRLIPRLLDVFVTRFLIIFGCLSAVSVRLILKVFKDRLTPQKYNTILLFMETKRRIEFIVQFNGQLTQIDANTFINSLLNTTSIIQAINKELDPSKKIEVKVNTLDERGSFPVSLEIVENAIISLLSNEGINYVKNILEAFVAIFLIKQFLKGKKAKTTEEQEDNIKIENESGEVRIFNKNVFNIYIHNLVINEAVNKNFETLESEPAIEGFEIKDDKGQELFVAKKEYFPIMRSKNEMLHQEDLRIINKDVTLHVFKVVFDEKYKWEFYYKGNKISAQIQDKTFFEGIDKGESFSKGDVLNVEMQIEQIFDKTVNTYVNKSYQILTVKNHIPRDIQQSLELPE
jgi:hypothetical protein